MAMTGLARILGAAMISAFLMAPVAAAENSPSDSVGQWSTELFFGDESEREAALANLAARQNIDVAATLILAMRYQGNPGAIAEVLSDLAGERLINWEQAMLWQEANPQIVPHPSYRIIKVSLFQRIDPEFIRFLGGERSDREKMEIRLEEITWGGVRVDGIPALDNPTLISAADASYLKSDDLIFGVAINGDARAYPLRIMGWHEMFNDVIGGVPVALAYCTLCGSGILYETEVEGRDKPLVFGSSGFLFRSNKLMFDRETDSLWNQFTGKPVTGPLVEADIELVARPVTITSWENWLAAQPQTTVLSRDTGYRRNYGSGFVYSDYFASPDLMFPAIVGDESEVKRKDFIFGIQDVGIAKAWPVKAFTDRGVINDAIGTRNLVLVGDASTRTVRAFERGDLSFEAGDQPGVLLADGTSWQVAEDGLEAADGRTLGRVPGRLAYWFAWDNYMGGATAELFTE
ncbi:MAG: DUF3179 domain-containing protein [Alphaproteobacteria bacterium]|nr:DUF3179 domain-containing protein [Alphaproteobacteria bacterium]